MARVGSDGRSSSPSSSSPKSKFVEQVIEAITNLAERNGSSTKDILNYVLRSSKTTNRNLTVQVRQALKQAASEGLIRLRGSRYKICPAKPARPEPTTTKTASPQGKKNSGGAKKANDDSRVNKKPDEPKPKPRRRPRGRPKKRTTTTTSAKTVKGKASAKRQPDKKNPSAK